LTLYYLGHDASQQQQVIEKTISGSIVFNDMLIQATQSRLPFGGTGDSGIGHYHGYEGFLELSHQRSLVKKGKFNSTRFGLPPYGRLIHKLLSRFFVR
jgi:coniferyl-aldehyde dehydrogenase